MKNEQIISKKNRFNSVIFKLLVALPIISYIVYYFIDNSPHDYLTSLNNGQFFSLAFIALTTILDIILIFLSSKKHKYFFITILLINFLIFINV
ncbi:MAG: hypothetical protein Q8P20_08375 [bacterium]|nr:hypothetical protein [bacterium]